MARRRRGPAFPVFPKFKSGTLGRRYISRPEDDEHQRKRGTGKPTEKFQIKWEPEARRDHERLMREKNFNENDVWDVMREKFGLKVYSLFQELSNKHYSNIGDIKRALVAIEIRFLSKKYPHASGKEIAHRAVDNIRLLGW